MKASTTSIKSPLALVFTVGNFAERTCLSENIRKQICGVKTLKTSFSQLLALGPRSSPAGAVCGWRRTARMTGSSYSHRLIAL